MDEINPVPKKDPIPFWVYLILVSLLILAPIFHLPYGYYQFLRLAVTFCAILFSYLSRLEKKKVWLWLYVFIALLYNPIIPFHLDRSTWAFINFATVIAVIVFYISRNKNIQYKFKDWKWSDLFKNW